MGCAFENHRKRIWEYHGFTVKPKIKYGAADWTVDCTVFLGEDLILMEEDKASLC